ncbi:MAG: hypothetical protein CMN32_13055 [Saprospirales bacterium]|nr:hypothetical protein [Saprospirales bacterium]
MHRSACLFLVFLFSLRAVAQISFTNQTEDLLDVDTTYTGIAVAVADMNGDGLDDIVRMHFGTNLLISYQNAGGGFVTTDYGMSLPAPWAVATGDANNDGLMDLYTGGFYDGPRVLFNQNAGAAFNEYNLPGTSIFVQGANFADINNDGYLDVFSCHDDGESRIWGNDGAGGFFSADNWIDMKTIPSSDNSGNYGSVWTDFDNDHDLDLYIAKCRQGVSNPEDPRRINALFVNDGANNYKDKADEYGLKIKWQSWTADFQDIDNDGDLDCLITNHDHNLQLLENDGAGHFTDISDIAGLAGYNGGFLQGLMRDFDNDGWVDILTAEPTLLLLNNGDKTFSKVNAPFDGANLGSFAIGDLNADGFPDVYASFPCGINNPCNVPDRLFINGGNGNHYLGVRLVGNMSNRAGVGARLEAHGPWGVQVREVRAGESYGISNSLAQHFGLGADTVVEQLVVRWPSGNVDVLSNVAADQVIIVEESTTCAATSGLEIGSDAGNVLCPGDTLTLTATAGYENYLWSNGASGAVLSVALPGNYSVVALDSNGCVASSAVFSVVFNPEEAPVVTAAGELSFCEGGNVELTASDAAAYLWSNGETGQSILVEEPGAYFVTVPGACGDFSSDTVLVEVYQAPPPVVEQVVQATSMDPLPLVAQGDHPLWYDSPAGGSLIAEGDTLWTPAVTDTLYYYVADQHSYGGGSFMAGMEAHSGSPYSGAGFNGQVLFDAYQDFILKTVKVYTDIAAPRIIQLLDATDNVVQQDTFDIAEGESELNLNFSVPAGNGYKLTTDAEFNQLALGTITPRLQRSDQGVNYPYEVPDVLSIIGSNFGAGFYYYFYNWQVELEAVHCESERVSVTVLPVPNAVVDLASFGKIALSPNPGKPGISQISISPTAPGNMELRLTDQLGRVLETHQLSLLPDVEQSVTIGKEIQLPEGIYFIQLRQNGRVATLKWVVVD